MSDGATRPMDARALTFLERMGAKVALIDLTEKHDTFSHTETTVVMKDDKDD